MRRFIILLLGLLISPNIALSQECLSLKDGEGTVATSLSSMHANFLAYPRKVPFHIEAFKAAFKDEGPFYICGMRAANYLQNLAPSEIPSYCDSLPRQCNDIQVPVASDTGLELEKVLTIFNSVAKGEMSKENAILRACNVSQQMRSWCSPAAERARKDLGKEVADKYTEGLFTERRQNMLTYLNLSIELIKFHKEN